MECLDTIKHLKINLKKNVGPVVIVVEGAEYEFELLYTIFYKILKYKLITKSRNKQKFKEYTEFAHKNNENSKFIIINTKNSNIGTIANDDEYRSAVYRLAYEKYNLDLKNYPIYYIWDRDCKSNPAKTMEELIKKLKNPYENENYESGLLLVSYPCIESFTISCFEKNTNFIDKSIKTYIKDKQYWLTELSRYSLLKATLEMIKHINKLGYHDFEIDDIGNINLEIFKKEEKIYLNKRKYHLVSFLSYILLDLGIITIKSNE